jgi:hypothetical protein
MEEWQLLSLATHGEGADTNEVCNAPVQWRTSIKIIISRVICTLICLYISRGCFRGAGVFYYPSTQRHFILCHRSFRFCIFYQIAHVCVSATDLIPFFFALLRAQSPNKTLLSKQNLLCASNSALSTFSETLAHNEMKCKDMQN